MTRILIDKKNKIWQIRIEGHAEYSKHGEPDIVCASVSMLTGLLQQILEDERKYINIKSMTIESGRAFFIFKISDLAPWVHVKLDVIITGFELLENNYPENVCIEPVKG